jgi:WD40 repeat protein
MPPSSQPRVFLSYARSDGADYAAWLRAKLEKEHPDITLWHDIVSERAGRDWWLQITQALDHVAYMVLVATPNALSSDMVRKEWRYARQKGVCVLPVAASNHLDFDSLPRWMKTQQFADLKVEAQWQVFAADLRRPCQAPRVPFMAEDLPPDFVQRPKEFEPILQLLLDKGREQGNPVAITTALRGAGGFGKTTLAKAVCHDPRIHEAFDDGVLWVTLGERVDNLVGKVAELTTVLSGEPANFTGKEAAVTRLRELLADRDILMVIDDVWNPAHLEPFLQGGPYCARLVTTRNLETLPRQTRNVKVDSMRPAEAAGLLAAGLPPDCPPQIDALARRLGKWPLLLGIVNGVLRERVDEASQSLPGAISDVNQALDEGGLTAFDPDDADARNRAVDLTVTVSLERFSPEHRERLQELSIFPEDTDIPLNVVEIIWGATAGLKAFAVQELCVKLNRHSLLQTLDLTTRQLRLHDVMRTYLHDALAKRTDAKQVHGRLIDGWGEANKLPNEYAWRWYAYHMAAANRETELRELLLNPAWLQAKLAATDVTALTADFDYLANDEDLQLVQGALRLSSHVIAKDPGQFASQIVGRLLPLQDVPSVKAFLTKVIASTNGPWLRALTTTLYPPGTALKHSFRTSAAVQGVSFNQERHLLVAATGGKTLIVWDLDNGREKAILRGHSDWINGVALDASARIAISASRDKTLKVWDLVDGQVIRTLVGHTGSVQSVSLDADGRIAASASRDRTVKLWEVKTGCELRTLSGHTSWVNAVCISVNGQHVISASRDRTLRLWEVDTGRELHTVWGHSGWVNAVAMSADARLALSGSQDGTLKLWDIRNGRSIMTMTGHFKPVNGVALDEQHQLAISASDDGSVKVWNLATGEELQTLEGHSGWVYAVALSDDAQFAVSGSSDSTAKLWDLRTGRHLRSVHAHGDSVNAIAIARNGRLACSASDDSLLKIWDVGTGQELCTLKGHSSWVLGVALSPDARLALSGSRDRTVKLWDVNGACELRNFKGHTDWVLSVVLSLDGQLAASASRDAEIKIWDVQNGREVRSIRGHDDSVNSLSLSDNRILVSASKDKTIKVWDLESGREIRTLAGHTDYVNSVSLAREGTIAISASRDCTLKVWDIATGNEIRTLLGHTRSVYEVELSPDGYWAVSGSGDHTVRLWDVRQGKCLAAFTGEGSIDCCRFAFHLRRILAGDTAGHIHFIKIENCSS